MQNWLNKFLEKEVIEFVKTHEKDDLSSFVLKAKSYLGIPSSVLADQIAARKKARIKLPSFYQTAGLVFPPQSKLEQSSSELTANFKCQLLIRKTTDRELLVDLTGGFGVDAFAFCRHFEQVVSVDPDEQLNQIVRLNSGTMKLNNFVRETSTAEAFLTKNNKRVSCFFIDPSRRSSGHRVVKFSDCVPDVTSLLDKMLTQSDFVLVKASPMLDITEGQKQLGHVSEVVVLSIANECRELLYLCTNGAEDDPLITSVNLPSEGKAQIMSFTRREEANAVEKFAEPQRFLYEPNTSIMKAGAFRLICARYGLQKLAPSSHLYTSDLILNDFPGRAFEILKLIKPSPSAAAPFFPEGRANIIVRNYPEQPDSLLKKLKLREGGTDFIVASSTTERKVVMAARRLY